MNMNSRSIILKMNTKSMCSTLNGLCRVKLPFPNTQFFVLTSPNNGNHHGWYIDLSFFARLIIYVMILGFVVGVIFFMLKYLGACNTENEEAEEEQPESAPLLPEKGIHFTYGTSEEDLESGIRNSAEDLYDGKICAICYDEERNCFFVPCGHCATCYECAKRIVDGENKVCPICRRLIQKISKIVQS